jgi:hypothetical protein
MPRRYLSVTRLCLNSDSSDNRAKRRLRTRRSVAKQLRRSSGLPGLLQIGKELFIDNALELEAAGSEVH